MKKLKLGVKVINISAGKKPLRLFVIFASGILNCQSSLLEALQMKVFLETIEAGANAITYTPPSNGELFSKKMQHYREMEKPD